MKTYYLAVTPDQLELPMIVAESIDELSRLSGFGRNTIENSMYRNRSGKITKMKFVKVKEYMDE